MSDLTPKEIAAWHRAEAKKHQELAVFHKKTADKLEFPDAETRVSNQESKGREANSVHTLSLEQFEGALAEKGGRVNHLAARLQASEDTIWDLLNDPKCKFVVGDRGFIYPKA